MRRQRGFVLIVVLLTLVLMTTAVLLTLRQAQEGLRDAAGHRASELVQAAAEHGLNAAIEALENADPADLVANDYDIFENPKAELFVSDGDKPLSYPEDGPFKGAFEVGVGIRLVQRSQAPVGEDVTKNDGFVAEILIRVQSTQFGNQAEHRSVVGVQVPHLMSHAM